MQTLRTADSRRRFLQHMAALAAIPWLGQIPGRRKNARIGLSLAAYSFRDALTAIPARMTLEQFVDFCADQDLEGTELTSYYFPDTDPQRLADLRRQATVNGLTITGTPIRNNFCQPPGVDRDKDLEHVRRWIKVAAQLGSQTIRLFAGDADVPLAEKQAWCIDCLRIVAEDAARHGVVLAIENHGGITQTAEQLLTLIRGVDSRWVGVNLDTGNFGHDAYEQMALVAPHAVACQVKVKLPDADGRKVEADFDRIVSILRKAQYRGFATLEYEEGRPLEEVPQYLQKLRGALAR